MTSSGSPTSLVRAPQRRAPRRAEILEASRRLFDSDGIGPVTVGRVARESGISPGNVYYWFPSKEELVRELFREWVEDSRIQVEFPDDPASILGALWDRPAAQQRVDHGYGFFQRELVSVLRADPVLAAEYRNNYDIRIEAFSSMAERVVDAGLLRRPAAPEDMRALVTALWLLAETAVPFRDAIGDPMIDATRLTRAVLGPLLTAAGRATLGIEVSDDDA